jgi:hypothetical protein
MWWIVGALSIATFIASMLLSPKPPMPVVASSGRPRRPTSQDGREIPIIFGTVLLKDPNITFFGDTSSQPNFDGPVNSPFLTGFDYFGSVQYGLCHGEIDGIKEIVCDGKNIWDGWASMDGQSIGVRHQFADKDVIWGSGTLKLGMASSSPNVGASDYVAEQLGAAYGIGPSYFHVASFLARNNNFGPVETMRPYSFRVQRILKRQCGTQTQWNPTKAIIRSGMDMGDTWKYLTVPHNNTDDCSGVSFDDSGWPSGRGPFGVANIIDASKIWLRVDLGKMAAVDHGLKIWSAANGIAYLNGVSIDIFGPAFRGQSIIDHPTLKTSEGSFFCHESLMLIEKALIDPDGPNILAIRFDGDPGATYVSPDENPLGKPVSGAMVTRMNYLVAGAQVGEDASNPRASVDMNPAHIIREIITDEYFGIAWPDEMIDDDSFEDAADTLYAEGIGMSLEVNEPDAKAKDLIDEVLRHISGSLDIVPSTGLYSLRLFRAASPELALTDANVVSIENGTRRAVSELTSSITVKYNKVGGDQGTSPANDTGLIEEQGTIIPQTVEYSGITNQLAASRLAWRDLKGMSSPLFSCDLTVNRSAYALRVGSPITLTNSQHGLDALPMRVTKISWGDATSTAIKLSAIEDAFYLPEHGGLLPSPAGAKKWPPKVKASLYTARIGDEGHVTCCYTGNVGTATTFFQNWTEYEPGKFRRNILGPLLPEQLDGVNAWTGDAATESTPPTGTPWMIGQRIVGNSINLPSNQVRYQAVFVIVSTGGYWNESIWVSEYAELHYDPQYSATLNYQLGMRFYVDQGDDYGEGYLTLTAAGELGVDDLTWDWTETVGWTGRHELLTTSQLDSERVSREDATISSTFANGTVDYDGAFETMVGTPGIGRLPAGTYEWHVPAWLTAIPANGSAWLGFKLYQVVGSGGSVVGETTSSERVEITSTTETQVVVRHVAAQISNDPSYRLVLIPTHTSTATGGATTTINVRINSLARESYLVVPWAPAEAKEITGRFFHSAGTPDVDDGGVGDYCLDETNLVVYRKTLPRTWTEVTSLGGMQLLNGAGAPSSGAGNNGDYYLNTTTNDLYQKVGGTWSIVATLGEGGGGVTDHEDLTGIQGGMTGQHYHLTSEQVAAISNIVTVHNDLSSIQGGAAGDRQHLTTDQVATIGKVHAIDDPDDEEDILYNKMVGVNGIVTNVDESTPVRVTIGLANPPQTQYPDVVAVFGSSPGESGDPLYNWTLSSGVWTHNVNGPIDPSWTDGVTVAANENIIAWSQTCNASHRWKQGIYKAFEIGSIAGATPSRIRRIVEMDSTNEVVLGGRTFCQGGVLYSANLFIVKTVPETINVNDIDFKRVPMGSAGFIDNGIAGPSTYGFCNYADNTETFPRALGARTFANPSSGTWYLKCSASVENLGTTGTLQLWNTTTQSEACAISVTATVCSGYSAAITFGDNECMYELRLYLQAKPYANDRVVVLMAWVEAGT